MRVETSRGDDAVGCGDDRLDRQGVARPVAYDPALVAAPVAIIRGEWDNLMRDDDARWLFEAFTRSPIKRDIKIGRGTHLMHLETMRLALWQESTGFLRGDDAASAIGEVR
jgi:hypothetical protein